MPEQEPDLPALKIVASSEPAQADRATDIDPDPYDRFALDGGSYPGDDPRTKELIARARQS